MKPGDNSPVTSGDLFDVFHMLSEKIDEKHTSVRETVEALYQRLGARIDEHEHEDRGVADRVLRMEASRSAEQSEALRNEARRLRETDLRVGLFSVFVSAVVSVGVWLLSKVWPGISFSPRVPS